jgi:hypothetical protein
VSFLYIKKGRRLDPPNVAAAKLEAEEIGRELLAGELGQMRL